jgi:hypothetical protein
MAFPAEDKKLGRVRRTALGPVTRMAQASPDAAKGDPPFCPCCLLTNSFVAFREPIEGDACYGVRLFACDGEGNPGADCRIKGDDWEKGRSCMPAPRLRWETRSASKMWCYKLWSTAPGQIRDKLRVSCYREV